MEIFIRKKKERQKSAIAKKCMRKVKYTVSDFTTELSIVCECIDRLVDKTRLLNCTDASECSTPAYFNINDKFFAQQHFIWSALAMSLLAANKILIIFIFGLRWMRGVINLFCCKLFTSYSIVLLLLFFFSLPFHQHWHPCVVKTKRKKWCWHFSATTLTTTNHSSSSVPSSWFQDNT